MAYDEDKKDIYSKLEDLKTRLEKLNDYTITAEKKVTETAHKEITILRKDFQGELDKLDGVLENHLLMIRDLGEAYRLEIAKLLTKFSIAVAVIGGALIIVLEVGSRFALEKVFG